MKISMSLSPSSIDAAIKQIEAYKNSLQRKCDVLAERLASMGAVIVSLQYARTPYTGNADYDITVDQRGPGKYAVIASGETVLILEFGAGMTYGYGHPQAGEFGFGPGTYPGQTHAFDPHGWWIPKSAGGGHTYGNPPARAMYNAAKDIRSEIERIAQEVFNGD